MMSIGRDNEAVTFLSSTSPVLELEHLAVERDGDLDCVVGVQARDPDRAVVREDAIREQNRAVPRARHTPSLHDVTSPPRGDVRWRDEGLLLGTPPERFHP